MHKKAVLTICLLNDMTTLISAGKDKTIKVWNIATYENICSLQDHSDIVNSITVSSDQMYLFSGGNDKKVIIYFVQNWQKLCVLDLNF